MTGESLDSLICGQTKCFLTLPEERLIIAKRQHEFVLFFPIVSAVFFCLFVFVVSGFLFWHLSFSPWLFISFTLLLIALVLNTAAKAVTDWHFHLYVVTDRKIMEIAFRPFFSDLVNSVFLDQVRATEVDVRVGNLWGELVNQGDVMISFDRPSHDASFILSNIKNPYQTGMILGDALESTMAGTKIWFKRGEKHEHQYTDDYIDRPTS